MRDVDAAVGQAQRKRIGAGVFEESKSSAAAQPRRARHDVGVAVREHDRVAGPSRTEGPPGIVAQQLPWATAWYSITCSAPGISSGATSRDGGASAAQSRLPLTLKNTAPRRRMPRSTSDSVS